MFTGIVEEIGRVESIKKGEQERVYFSGIEDLEIGDENIKIDNRE